jgi:6-pyruvoyltetrahydropterin/6-carboxytetrahydropterin synthase
MVMDFGDLKKIVRTTIIDVYDHALVLNSCMPEDLNEKLSENFEKVILLNYQPTSEMMVVDFANTLMKKLPPDVKLKYLQLRETVTSFAEWYAEDN